MRNPWLAASHIYMLVRAIDQSEGDILEVGTGYFSTPIIHWLAGLANRKVVSLDAQEKWANLAKETYGNEWHEVKYVENMDEANLTDRHWGVVLIDHSPDERRWIDAKRVAKNATFVILHDSEPNNEHKYKYSLVYSRYKYIYQDAQHYPWTAVLSNEKEFRP